MSRIVAYQDAHFKGVDTLWSQVFPDDLSRNQAKNAIPTKMALKDGLFWVAENKNGDVAGTIMAGWDGHRGWLYTVAVHPQSQRSGIGRTLVEHALKELLARGCTKVNLQIRTGNEAVAAFYRTLGFTVEERLSMGREI